MTWLRRCASILGVTALGIVVLVSTTAPMAPTATIPLYQDGLQVTAEGELIEVPAGRPVAYHPSSRVPLDQTDDASLALVAEHQDWLASGRVCGTGTATDDGAIGDAVANALLDIHALTGSQLPDSPAHADGALVAGWEPRWRYVWPRDTSFAAAALATAGHVDDAVAALAFLGSMQESDGTFAARYLPTGDGVPDGRAAQLDGSGWVLWASDLVVNRADDDGAALSPAVAAERLQPLATRATDALLTATDDASRLPAPSPDYWEVHESELTLGTAAVVLAGLEAAGRMPDVVGADLSSAAATRAAEVRDAVVARFGPGFRRHGGSALTDGRDAATAFLLPPIGSGVEGGHEAWLASITEMARIGGGVAPGATWKPDGISWTPQTTLYALTAASTGETELARELLDWILEHRTASGAIPEKVLADGSPAAVAPLAWSAANVVLAVCALDDAA